MIELSLGEFHVKEIVPSTRSALSDDGVLEIDCADLVREAARDKRIRSASVEVVRPNESVRVTHVCDAIEPRLKVRGGGPCYPGMVEPGDRVGRGSTYRTRGAAVVLSADYPASRGRGGTGAALDAVLDMSGPGALGPLSKCHNVVLVVDAKEGLSETEAHEAVRSAGFRVADQIAHLLLGRTPIREKLCSLVPVKDELPKVVYVQQVLTNTNLAVPYMTWYGIEITNWPPLLIHPNELLDGALLPNAFGGHAAKPTSWEHVNNPIVSRLYELHGRELDFVGAILQRTRFETMEEKRISAAQTAQLARQLRVDGALISWLGAGNAFIETMLTVQAMEREGIQAVLLTYEHGGKEGKEDPLLFSVPEADALVSLGSLDRPLSLPAVERVVGSPSIHVSPETGSKSVSAYSELGLEWRLPVVGAVDQLGFGHERCEAY